LNGVSVGNATLYKNEANMPVGFYDYYNFNPLWMRTHRSISAELETITVYYAGRLVKIKGSNKANKESRWKWGQVLKYKHL
jgi:hypothetical protein